MDVARVLIDNGADVGRRDKAGRTPLQLVDDAKARAALEAFAAAVAAEAAGAGGTAAPAGVPAVASRDA
jgi:ankyrin repeat protein